MVGIADAAAPNAEREAALIAGSLEDVTLLLGAQATRAAFAEAARTSHRIHLATHAKFIASEAKTWAQVVKDANVKAEG